MAQLPVESRAYKLFIQSINAPSTRKFYIKSLNKFCNYTSLTYDEIVKLDTEDLQVKLEDWVIDMSQRGIRASSVLTPLAAVEHFLEINRRLYHKKALHKLVKRDMDIGGGTLPATSDDIRLMLEATTKLRSKAVVLCIASMGIRPGAFEDPVLRMKHRVRMHDKNGKDTGCYAIKVYDNSIQGYWAFWTPEASAMHDRYISSRKTNGEKITPDSPLFAGTYDSENTHLTVRALYRILSDLYKAADIDRGEKRGRRYDKALTYGFRKRFNTILKINNDINSNIAEKLMSHNSKTIKLDGTYLAPTLEQCFAEFQKAIPELTIDETRKKDLIIKRQQQELNELEEVKLRLTRVEMTKRRHETILQDEIDNLRAKCNRN